MEKLFTDFAHEGVVDLTLTPLNVVVETDTLWHEIGNITHKEEPHGGLYYARWIKPGDQWLYAFDMMTVGSGFKRKFAAQSSKPATSASQAQQPHDNNVTQVVSALQTMWTALLDTGDYEGVAAMYNPGAQLIPPEHSTEFLTQDKFAAVSYTHLTLPTIYSV